MMNLALVDSNVLFRESLGFSLSHKDGFDVVLSAVNFSNLESDLPNHSINIVLFDIADLEVADPYSIKRIKHQYPEIKFMILSNLITKSVVLEYFEFGVSGFFSKRTDTISLVQQIKKAFFNKNPFDVQLGKVVTEELIENSKFLRRKFTLMNIFTKKEIDILELIANQKSNVEISQILGVSSRTIESHRSRMIKKTNSRNIIGVLMLALGREQDFMVDLEKSAQEI